MASEDGEQMPDKLEELQARIEKLESELDDVRRMLAEVGDALGSEDLFAASLALASAGPELDLPED
ncbi:hypothetical protein ACVDG3_14165 [Meridianimarinicoccus sp. RP-17]|uniref:hypothetical protein n=1 Tax=Meridianimarinicoccus zhengii TaxID=2056810 RepID=UPI000DAE5E2B|nr:hypothetical protein [Phycocomes zhengii]